MYFHLFVVYNPVGTGIAVIRWGHSRDFFESFHKIAAVSKPQLFRYLLHGIVGIRKQEFCLFDFLLQNVLF